MRLQKFLSRAGASSRREGERLIQAGRVRVNGRVVTELGTRVEPDRDQVELDGESLSLPGFQWILLHKPAGVLTTADDPGGGAIVYDLLPERFHGLRYVGRLDRETEGLLLLTNEGDVLHRLTHPSYQVEREYRAWVEGPVSAATLRRLVDGVELEDGPARAVRAWSPSASGPDEICLVLTEGRNREVRRMLEAVGHPVRRLVRQRFGPVALGTLAAGRWRELTKEEIHTLRQAPSTRSGPAGSEATWS
ncbi:MAG: pseudouridine synthase [Gemmatimonadota bacterium]